jgi:hypothetical protein
MRKIFIFVSMMIMLTAMLSATQIKVVAELFTQSW